MIVRFVKMTFHGNQTATFEDLFNARKALISGFTGCQNVELLKSKNNIGVDDVVYFTHSIWDSEEDLQNYRKSELFKETWHLTKQLFSDKPEAWTLDLAS